MKDLNEEGKSRHDMLKKRHDEKFSNLKKEKEKFDNLLIQIRLKNKTEEDKLRQEYNKADRNY